MPRPNQNRSNSVSDDTSKADMPKDSDKPKDGEKKDGHPFKTGVAVGIGSAAIVAALLYARSGSRKK
jgi:hypothetical protein